MTDTTWEHDSDQAWSTLEGRLASWLEEVPADGWVVLNLDVTDMGDLEEGTPYVQMVVEGMTVQGRVGGNGCLVETFRLNAAQQTRLVDLGWEPYSSDGSADYHCSVEIPDESTVLARRVVATLREVHGVLDPSFLVVSGRRGDGEWEPQDLPLGLRLTDRGTRDVDTTVAVVECADDLRDLVADVVTSVTGDEAEFDPDGDIPVLAGDTVVYVRVAEECPAVRVFGAVLQDVRWTPRVGHALNDVNRRLRFAKVHYSGGYLTVSLSLDCVPFVPETLRRGLSAVCELVEELGDELQASVGGRSLSDDSEGAA